MKGKKLWASAVAGVVACAVLVGGVLAARERPAEWHLGERFVPGDVRFGLYDLYDMSAARIDGDDRLDLYTVNHSAMQYAFMGDGRIRPLHEFGLGQDANHPGIEDDSTTPVFDTPGIVVYRKDKRLHVEDRVNDEETLDYPVRFTISAPWPLRIDDRERARAEPLVAVDDDLADGHTGFAVELDAGGAVTIVGEQRILEVPHRLKFDDADAAARVLLGTAAVPVNGLSARLWWRDRHSMAWRDIDGDGDSDVFVARGGVKGQLGGVSAPLSDELFVRDGSSARDVAAEAALIKGDCPARQSAWVDIDVDGLLDIHMSCGRGSGGSFPDRVYIAQETGGYVERAADFGLAFEGVRVFRWFDVDRDGDSDMLSADGRTLVLYRNEGGRFERELVAESLASKPGHIALADIDGNGFVDAVTVQARGSLVVLNEGGALEVGDIAALGLPDALRAVTFVDIDLDGELDAHLVPGGVYWGGGEGRFAASGLLDDGRPIKTVSSARCTWFDREVDGVLDAVCAVERYPGKAVRLWKKYVERRTHARFWTLHDASLDADPDERGHWLQLDLDAGEGNPDGIGASVEIVAADRSRVQFVGQHEGAHFSQGHYRLYFGLGDDPGPYRALVRWPGGASETFLVEEGDRLVTLGRGKGRPS